MLVLTRRPGESIMIGDLVEVSILSSYNTLVRLGITAPKEIPIHRLEIYQKIKQSCPIKRDIREKTDE